MARIVIPFTVEKQHITQPTREVIVAGGQNYFYATFTINEVWEDIKNVKAVFNRDNISKPVPLIETETGYECVIPWEVMADRGSFQVGIFGGDRLLTDYAYVIVKEGCVVDGESPLPPTPDWFTKIEEDVEIAKEAADSIGDLSTSVDELSSETEVIKSDIEGLQQQIREEAHFRGYCQFIEEVVEIEATPNDFAYCAETGTVWVYNGEEWKSTDEVVPDQMTPASNATPLMNGEASVGKENAYARGDHRHPTDTTRVSVTEFNKFKNDPKEEIQFTHDISIEARADGLYLSGEEGNGTKLFDAEHEYIYADEAYYAEFAYVATVDGHDRALKGIEIEELDESDAEDFYIRDGSVVSFGVVNTFINATLEKYYRHIGFTSALYFATPSVIPENYSQFPADITFDGDSTDNGAFVPEAHMRYTIVFDFDGFMMNGYVKGVTTV